MDRLRPHELREDLDALAARIEDYDRAAELARRREKRMASRIQWLEARLADMNAIAGRTELWKGETDLVVPRRPVVLHRYIEARRLRRLTTHGRT